MDPSQTVLEMQGGYKGGAKGETADFKTSRLQKTSRDFTRLQAQRLQIFRRLLKTSGDFRRLQKTSKDFKRL